MADVARPAVNQLFADDAQFGSGVSALSGGGISTRIKKLSALSKQKLTSRTVVVKDAYGNEVSCKISFWM